MNRLRLAVIIVISLLAILSTTRIISEKVSAVFLLLLGISGMAMGLKAIRTKIFSTAIQTHPFYLYGKSAQFCGLSSFICGFIFTILSTFFVMEVDLSKHGVIVFLSIALAGTSALVSTILIMVSGTKNKRS